MILPLISKRIKGRKACCLILLTLIGLLALTLTYYTYAYKYRSPVEIDPGPLNVCICNTSELRTAALKGSSTDVYRGPSTVGYRGPTTNVYRGPTTYGHRVPTTNVYHDPTTTGYRGPTTIANRSPTTNSHRPSTGDEDNIHLFKDLYSQEPWAEVESNVSEPGQIPYNVHYFWCGQKLFRFEDYVGLLSVVRILGPQKIIFHYHHLPYVDKDWYHTWFQELKQSTPNLVLRYTRSPTKCGSPDILEFVLTQLVENGGVYVGERTVLTHVPREAWSEDFYYSFRLNDVSGDVTQGIIFSKSGFPKDGVKQKLGEILNSPRMCYLVEEFSSQAADQIISALEPCIALWESLYPRDIWNAPSRFSELARWLYYGSRGRLGVKADDRDLIPMTSHIVWLKNPQFHFLHYLSVISALHVAGFQRVYIHGSVRPHGEWWDRLQGQNVTFIKIEEPEKVFQQSVLGPAHQSDVLRLMTLLKYGGAYQVSALLDPKYTYSATRMVDDTFLQMDRDVIWVSRIPESLRRYPAVTCPDWPLNGEWPEAFNMGVMMAKKNSDFLKNFLKTFKYYRDDKWAFNAVFMPYKAYELHPDQLFVDRHLQVICFKGICHPAWHKDYIRDISDPRPVEPFDWRDARAFHFTVPKPPHSLSSPQAIRDGTDMFSEIGRMILQKSDQAALLS